LSLEKDTHTAKTLGSEMNGIVLKEINYFSLMIIIHLKHGCGINMNTTRDKCIDCLKELQKLPQDLGLLFKKTYPKGTRIDFCLGFCRTGLVPSYMEMELMSVTKTKLKLKILRPGVARWLSRLGV